MTEDASGARMMGIWMTSALVVGSMIGVGVFLLPVSLAPLGPNAIAGWIVSSLGALALAWCLANLARQDGAGIQAYVERAFGPWVGFLVTWAFWCSNWTGNAAIAIAFAATLARIVPAINEPRTIALVAIGAIALIALINAAGARAAGRVAIVTTLIKLVPLVAVILIVAFRGAAGGKIATLAPVPLSIGGIAGAVALTLFALTGFENATAPVGKVRDPGRTIPRAVIGGTAFVALLYLFSSTAATLALPTSAVMNSPAPYADAIGSAWGEWAALLTAFAIAVSAFGTLNNGVLATGELSYSMALRGDLPKLLARTHHGNTPVISQLVAAVLGILLVLANSNRETAGLFTFVVLVSTSAVLVLYLVAALAALRRPAGLFARLITFAGIGFALFAFYGAGLEPDLWMLALLGVGVIVRLALNSRATSPAAAVAPAAPRE